MDDENNFLENVGFAAADELRKLLQKDAVTKSELDSYTLEGQELSEMDLSRK